MFLIHELKAFITNSFSYMFGLHKKGKLKNFTNRFLTSKTNEAILLNPIY